MTKFDTDLIPPFLARWACSALLGYMESELNQVRDSNVIYSAKTKPEYLLKELRKTMANSVDIASISPELIRFSTSRYFERESCDFVENIR